MAKINHKLLQNGKGSYCVLAGIRHTSPKGNVCLKLTIELTDAKSQIATTVKYLCGKNWIQEFCESCQNINLMQRFNIREITAQDCITAKGDCTIKTEVDPNGVYPDKSVVGRFTKFTGVYEDQAQEEIKFDVDSQGTDDSVPWSDDDIPF